MTTITMSRIFVCTALIGLVFVPHALADNDCALASALPMQGLSCILSLLLLVAQRL